MSAKTIPSRSDIENNDKWDLAPLFKSDAAWDELYLKISDEVKKYSAYEGKLSTSVDLLKELLDFDQYISRELEKLYTYAHLKNDEDKTNDDYNAMYQKALSLYTTTTELSSFISPEIQAMDDSTLKGFINAPEMMDYGFFMEKLLRYKPHTLSHEMEQLMAMAGDVNSAPSAIFSQLDNADLKFGTLVDEKGVESELSHGNFNSFLISPVREIRKNAFFQYYKSYDDVKHSISTSLTYSNKKDKFYAKARNFNSAREASLFSDKVDVKVYDNLLETVKSNMDPFVKYMNFRKDILNLDKLHFYDTYVPLVKDVDFNMPYDDAVDVCAKALKPLGDDYVEIFKKGLSSGWVDKYENKGKRSGAYSSGCYDSPPYILLNYQENNINSLYTLMHEGGHSMHSYFSCQEQSYLYSQYTIFVAEVASTFNETLLSHYLLDFYKDNPKMKAYILNREIDNIRATLYRQTMFAEFEKVSHAIIEDNQPLTLEIIRKEYRKLLDTYFSGSIEIDNVLELECLRIPHFYSAFYVYKYATGISAAIALAEKVLNEGENARVDYRNFLTLGGSMFPIEELKIAGVDMSTPEPVEKALKYFDSLVDKFIKVYGEL